MSAIIELMANWTKNTFNYEYDSNDSIGESNDSYDSSESNGSSESDESNESNYSSESNESDDDFVKEILFIFNKVLLIQDILMKEYIISLTEISQSLSPINGTQGM